ncbi:unnamed protein product [Thlaspi arvense]|uniref:Ribosome biogenesis regulatory protein n=1 Tax=Thlaspi arvense TaxID=13288 RepID=A0AAU9RRK2_THLAR|nr:unnamed protein product [Thlaspi arvense]
MKEELVKECLEKGTKLVQAVADALFNLPSTEDPDGPIVTLPPPNTKLPREKPVTVHGKVTILAQELLHLS